MINVAETISTTFTAAGSTRNEEATAEQYNAVKEVTGSATGTVQ